jgi:SRSO17 transposase
LTLPLLEYYALLASFLTIGKAQVVRLSSQSLDSSLQTFSSVGLDNAQPLHHFLANYPWDVNGIRQRRIWLILQALKCKSLIVCIDETEDKKKGKTRSALMNS